MNLEMVDIEITDISRKSYFFENVSFQTDDSQTILYVYNENNKRCAFFILNNIVAIEILGTYK